jgi:putative ABC transport system permease protein
MFSAGRRKPEGADAMQKQPLGIRIAIVVYRHALRLTGQRAIAMRRGEVLQSFREACMDAGDRAGVVGIFGRTLSELWDLLRASVAPRRRATHIIDHGQAPSTPPRGSRGWATDIRHAMRALAARRFDTALTVGLLALGLATTSSIFAVADALLLNPIPFVQADRLVQVWSTSGQSSITSVPRDLAVRWLDRTDLFSSGGVYNQASALVTSGGDPEVISAVEVSPGLFETLGVRPMLGRNFIADEGRAGTNHVVIIGADVWASRFGKAPDVIGRTLKINAIDYRVVGVMAPEFRFPYSRQRIWFPFDFRNPAPEQVRNQVTLVARMRPGLTRERVNEQVKAAGPAMAKLASRPWKMGASARYMDEVLMDPQTRRSIWMLFGATVLLMLTVCANVANLGLSQAYSRVRDAAIRSALGASRWRMIRQTLVEQLTVGALALLIALPLTAGAIELAAGLLPLNYTISSLNALDIDARLLAMMAALALTAPLLSGLIPAIAGSRPSVLSALKQESRSVAGSRGARWFRKGLVVLEVACSVVLLVSAALLVRSFIRLQAVEKGFDSHNLVSVNLGFPASYFADNVGRGLYLDQAVDRLRQMPGVLAATSASGVPPDSGGIQFGDVETDTQPASKVELVASIYDVHPEFFETMGMPMVAGRAFVAGELDSHVIVGENFAAKLWPGQNAVGRKFRWDDSTWHEVVGVVATVREGAGRGSNEAFPQYYVPVEKRVASTTPPRDAIPEWKRLAVRVADPAAAMPQIRAALKNLNPGILIQSVDLVDDQLAKELERPRFLLVLMLIFAGAGLVLAAVGVYGVLSCLVAEQLREYGIRLMLGASPAVISRQILFGGLTTTVVGLAIGAGAAAVLGKTINSVLFQVDARDTTSYVIVGVVLVAASLAAAWRPAKRARSVDPALLLRND